MTTTKNKTLSPPTDHNVSLETPPPLFCAANPQAAATVTPNLPQTGENNSQAGMSTATPVSPMSTSNQNQMLLTPNLSVNQMQASQPAPPFQSPWVNQVNPSHSPIQQMFHSAPLNQSSSFSPVMPTQSFNNQQVSQPVPMFSQPPSQQMFQQVPLSQSPRFSPVPPSQPINSQQVSQPVPIFLSSNPNPVMPGQFFNPQLPPFSFQALPQPPVSTQFNP